jgi:hypothetical protein
VKRRLAGVLNAFTSTPRSTSILHASTAPPGVGTTMRNGLAAQPAVAETGRNHQRRRAVRQRGKRIRAAVEQRLHRGGVVGAGGAHERRRPLAEVERRAGVVVTLERRPPQPRVRVGALRQQLLHQIDRIQLIEKDRRRAPLRPLDAVHVHAA